MKKIILISVLLIPIFAFAQWQNIYTTENIYNAIDVVNSDTVYVVGQYCAIRTLDGGETWNDVNFDCSELRISDVHFPTPRTGYIIGRPSVILKSENYGNDWYQLTIDVDVSLVKADFISSDTGWIIGQTNSQDEVIMRTYNGGTTWNYFYPDTDELTDIQMINADIGYITHYEGIIKTLDGGNTWFPLSGEFNGNAYLTCCSFMNPDTGFIAGGGLYKTENGGEQWVDLLSDYYWIGAPLNSGELQFLNSDTGYFVGYDPMPEAGKLCTTTDGGFSWFEVEEVGRFIDMEIFKDTIGYSVCLTGEIYKTTNGGIPVGVSEYDREFNPKIYPNPFIDKLFIDITSLQTSTKLPVVFELFDMKAKKVYSRKIETQKDAIHNLNELKAGIYIFSLKSGNTILKSGKILKSF